MALQATNADCSAARLSDTCLKCCRSAAGWAEYTANCYPVLGEVDAAGVAVAATSREMQTEAESNLDRTARTQATVNDQRVPASYVQRRRVGCCRAGCCRASAATKDEERFVGTSDLKALVQDDEEEKEEEEETMEHEAQAPNVRGRQAGTASKGKGRDRNKRCYVEAERMERVIHLRPLAATLLLPASEYCSEWLGMRWPGAIVILLKVAGLGRSVGCGRVCVCVSMSVPVPVRVFCVSRPGPWWRDQCKGHHAHATARQRLALADACCGRAARRCRAVRVASVEMALSLSLLYDYYSPYKHTKQTSWMSFLGLIPDGSAPPGLSPVGGVQGTATWQHVTGILLCMPVTPVRRRRRKASASRLRTAEDDNRRGPGCAWTYIPMCQVSRTLESLAESVVESHALTCINRL
jgi:hypothetical protein